MVSTRAPQAFCGDGPTDTGDLLDEVELHLFNGQSQVEARSIGVESSREYAVQLIIQRLHRYQAPALGFGGHYGVRRWENR